MIGAPDDVIIAGGGLAGLALAWFLQAEAPGLSLRVIEKRSHYTQDRHWSFWWPQEAPLPFAESVSARFACWRAETAYEHATAHGGRYHYYVIRSADWYAQVLAALGERVVLSSPCERVTPEAVYTPGVCYRGRMVINALPPDMSAASLFQQFQGWVVETDRPAFDTSCVRLMDFTLPQPAGACGFGYLIPFSPQRALVEPTQLTASPDGNDRWFEQSMQHLLRPLAGEEWHVMETERGCLPLNGLPRPQMQDGFPIGTRAGWMRPSTGYAFVNTLRQTQALARYIAAQHALPPQPWPAYRPLARAMDRHFLRVLSRHPDKLPAIFTHWFAAVDADRMVAFLQDEGGIAEAWAVIRHARHPAAFLGAFLP